jgi:hypothetical protein
LWGGAVIIHGSNPSCQLFARNDRRTRAKTRINEIIAMSIDMLAITPRMKTGF